MLCRRTTLPPLVILFIGLCLQTACAQTETDITITTANGTNREEQGREQLQRILATYDLGPWIFTREVVIEAFVIPHSHPVLTLSTKSLNDDAGQLTAFLHEQIHWFLVEHEAQTERAIEALRQHFPDAPKNREEGGARDEYSTYLHLIVCWLELDAASHLLGEEQARAILEANTFYTWVYARVLNDDGTIQSVIDDHDLLIDPN